MPRVVPFIHAASLQVVKIFSLSIGDQSSMIHVSQRQLEAPYQLSTFVFVPLFLQNVEKVPQELVELSEARTPHLDSGLGR